MNTFVEKGNISDVVSFMENDLTDTYNNQLLVLDKLYELESSNTAFENIPFFLNNTQYHLSKGADSRIVSVYLNNTNEDLVAEIDLDSDENVGMWASIDDLESDISDASDCTYTLLTALKTSDIDDLSQNVLNKFTAAVGVWMPKAGAMAKETYNAILEVLTTGVDAGASIVNWVLEQYRSIAGATANDNTGELNFHDTNYHVQGFAGSYALQVGFTVVSSVLSLVVATINPIIGLIVGGVAAAVRALIGLIPDKADTWAVESEAANEIFAVPIFQGTISHVYFSDFLNAGDNPDGLNYFSILERERSMTIRMAGWVIMLYLEPDNDMIKYEVFISCDFFNFPNSYLYSITRASDTAYAEPNPFLDYIISNVLAGRSLTPYKLPTRDVICDLLFMESQCVGANGYQSFSEQLNEYLGSDAALSVSDCQTYANNCLRASICLSLLTFVWTRATRTLSVVDPTASSTIPSKNGTDQDWLNYFCGCLTINGWPSWSDIVNKIIPRFRECYNASKGYASGIGTLASLGSIYKVFMSNAPWSRSTYPYQSYPGLMRIGKFRWTPPKYSGSARATTIALAITAAVVVTTAVIVKYRVQYRIRNKQIERYRTVQQNWNRYMETGSEEDLIAYRKSIKKYNRWSSFAGVSRLSGISGWEAGSDASTPSVPKSWNGFNNNDKYTQVNNDCTSVDLSSITRLIRGR